MSIASCAAPLIIGQSSAQTAKKVSWFMTRFESRGTHGCGEQ
jgi:hypothetical protein